MTRTELRIGAIFLRRVNPDQLTEKGAEALSGLGDFLQQVTVTDLGMSSADVVGMLDEIGDEFGVELPEEAVTWTEHRKLVEFLDR